MKKLRITQIKEDTESDLLKWSSYKSKTVIRIKYRRLNTKSSNAKW